MWQEGYAESPDTVEDDFEDLPYKFPKAKQKALEYESLDSTQLSALMDSEVQRLVSLSRLDVSDLFDPASGR